MKEAVTKVFDTITQENFYGTFQKLLERYSKCSVAGGDYFKGELSEFHVCTINKSAHTKKVCKPIEGTSYVIKIYMYKKYLALNNLQGLKCYKTLPNNNTSGLLWH